MIVAADQYETSPLVHDPSARRISPPSGRFAASLARFAAARRVFVAGTESAYTRRLGQLAGRDEIVSEIERAVYAER